MLSSLEWSIGGREHEGKEKRGIASALLEGLDINF